MSKVMETRSFNIGFCAEGRALFRILDNPLLNDEEEIKEYVERYLVDELNNYEEYELKDAIENDKSIEDIITFDESLGLCLGNVVELVSIEYTSL